MGWGAGCCGSISSITHCVRVGACDNMTVHSSEEGKASRTWIVVHILSSSPNVALISEWLIEGKESKF